MIDILDKIFKSPARVMLLYPPEVTDDNLQILHITKNIEEKRDVSQKLKQWLQKIPDDPSRLLRNKLLSKHRNSGQMMEGSEKW